MRKHELSAVCPLAFCRGFWAASFHEISLTDVDVRQKSKCLLFSF